MTEESIRMLSEPYSRFDLGRVVTMICVQRLLQAMFLKPGSEPSVQLEPIKNTSRLGLSNRMDDFKNQTKSLNRWLNRPDRQTSDRFSISTSSKVYYNWNVLAF